MFSTYILSMRKIVSDLQMAPGIDEKNMIFALKYACFPACFSSSNNFRGKSLNPKLRIQGWCASRVRWCTGSGCQKLS